MISPPEALAGARSRDTLVWMAGCGWIDRSRAKIPCDHTRGRDKSQRCQPVSLCLCACMPCLSRSARHARAKPRLTFCEITVQPSNRDGGEGGRARRVRVLSGVRVRVCVCEDCVRVGCVLVGLSPRACTRICKAPCTDSTPTAYLYKRAPLHWPPYYRISRVYTKIPTALSHLISIARPERPRYPDVM